MSSFREQLGEDWLRFQHHLDGASPSTITTVVSTNQPNPQPQTLPNGLGTSTRPSDITEDVLEDLPRPLLSSEQRAEADSVDAEPETESTLRCPLQSTLEESTLMSQGVVGSPGPSPDSQRSARAHSGDLKEEEEEEDLGGRVVL